MNDYDFLELPGCDNDQYSCTDSWFTDTSYIHTPISPSHSHGYDEFQSAETIVEETSSENLSKKTRVKWTSIEDGKLRRLFTKYPE
jgi:hypothetical protein